MASNSTGRVGSVFAIIDKGFKSVTGIFDYQTVDTRYIPVQAVPQCSLPGCHLPCYVENSGLVHDFCGRKHANTYKEMKEKEERQKRSRRQHHGGGGGAGFDTSPKQQRFNCSGVVGGQGQTHHAYGLGMNMPKRSERGVIRFYNKFDDYYQFTNFYYAPIALDGKAWPTTEHYFQAQKFVGTPFMEVIRNSDSPREAFDLSRNPAVSCWRRKDWEDVKVDIMRKALLAKFTQHEDLRQLLLSTGDCRLIEHTPHDKFWGNGGDGSGRNQLGLLLMELRSELRFVYNTLYQNMNCSSPVITKQPLGRGRGNELGRSRVGTDQGDQLAEEGKGSRSASPHRGLHQDVDLESDGKSESPSTANTESSEDAKTTAFVDDLIDFSKKDPEESVPNESCVSAAAPETSWGGVDLLLTAGDLESITELSEALPYRSIVTPAMSNASNSEGEVPTAVGELNAVQPVQAAACTTTKDIAKNLTDVASPPVGTASGTLTPTEPTQSGEPIDVAVEDNMDVTTGQHAEQSGDDNETGQKTERSGDDNETTDAMDTDTQREDEDDKMDQE